MSKLYAINEFSLELAEADIVRETDKTITTKQSLHGFGGYKNFHRKDSHPICRTPLEAWQHYKGMLEREAERHRRKLEEVNKNMAEVDQNISALSEGPK